MSELYHFEVMTPSGETVRLDHYQGKVLLIVNTASLCGFTPQFEGLESLYGTYRDQGFEILGFPCNQFEAQEPGSSEEAEQFCRSHYGVSFPMFRKLDVNGPSAHPMFSFMQDAQPFTAFDSSSISARLLQQMLQDKYPQLLEGNSIKWNFTKFLVDREGNVVKRFEPGADPGSFEADIQALL